MLSMPLPLSIFALLFWPTQSTHLTTLLNFNYAGELGLFNTEDSVETQIKYLEEAKSKWIFPKIINLEYYLSTLSGEFNCFITADNFQNVNMNQHKIPTILRSPVPLVHTFVSRDKHYWRLALGATTIISKNISADVRNLPCYISKLLVGLNAKAIHENNIIPYLCLVINHFEYFHRAKPPTCYIHLGIFPPQYVTTHQYRLVYPEIFNFDFKQFRPHYYQLSTATTFNIMVQLQHNNPNLGDTFQLVKKWMLTTKYRYLSGTQLNAFIILEVVRLNSSAHLFLVNGAINSAVVFKICYTCRVGNTADYGTLIQVKLKTFEASEISHYAFPREEENIAWLINDYSYTNSLISLMLKYSRTCHITLGHNQLWLEIASTSSSVEKVAKAHSFVWKSVMRNFTLVSANENENCYLLRKANFFIRVNPATYDKSLLTFSQYANDELTGLRFIGCGQRGMSMLPFREFITIFDKFIWVGIAATIAIVSPSIKLFLPKSNLLTNLFSLLKVILEQNDPFAQIVVKNTRLRLPIIFLLLVGIILSNAYKNTNIYKMVSPRKPILYQTFEELLRDNFRIYSRSLLIYVQAPINVGNIEVDLRPLDIFVENRSVNVAAEVDCVDADYQILYRGNGMKMFGNSSLRKLGIMRAAKLHPLVIPKLGKVLHHEIDLMKGNMTEKYVLVEKVNKIISKIYPQLQAEEKSSLLHLVEECQRTAVILPEYMCRAAKKFLAQERILRDVFIGRESYIDLDWTFWFGGLFPGHLIKRLHGVEQSGIWQWWILLLRKIYNDEVTEGHHVKAATMSGNIAIVFIMWVCCIIASVISILLEIYKFQKKACSCVVINMGKIEVVQIKVRPTSR